MKLDQVKEQVAKSKYWKIGKPKEPAVTVEGEKNAF